MLINTATGKIRAEALGRTLMHEHLVVGLTGWQSDTRVSPPDRRNMIAACIDRVEELRDAGFSTLVDPCPNDLGRDVDLIGEVAARTGFNIIFATGLYNESRGGSFYWNRAFGTDPDADRRLSDLFVSEIEQGVRGTGLKPGILKVATALPPFTGYEKRVFRAAAQASLLTGTPITTHTDGVLGDEQLDFLMAQGVAPSRIIIGHCCGNPDHEYHMRIKRAGAFVGFDRFGMEHIRPDADRIASLLALRAANALGSVVISHDSTCCWLGRFLPANAPEPTNQPLRFTGVIAPMLIQAGMTEEEIEGLLVANPRRYFSA